MRLFYAGDVHGSERCFRKFLNAARFYDAEVIILGGDITGKVMVPLVEQKPGRFVAHVFGRKMKAKRPDDVTELEKQIRFNGFYPYRCSPGEYDRLADDAKYREQVMSRLMVDEVKRWMEIADEKLLGSDIRCLIMPGNDDEWEIDQVMGSEIVENPDGRVVRIGDYQILSSAWANPTPWDSPREAEESRLQDIYEEIAAQLDPELPAIFNLHVPPYGSGLDMAAELDEELNVRKSGGQPNIIPVGSRAAREFIERHRPILGLHGHIHESRYATILGRTICINPGSNYADGVLDGAIVDLEGGEVDRYQLVSG